MRREGRAKLQKFQPVQESPGGGDTKGQQTKLLTSLDGGAKKDPPQFTQGWGEDSHARRWWPTRRRADAGNFHPKFALERQTGAAWNRLETGRARPLKVCRREFLSGRKAENKFCYFLAGRRKRIFFFFWPKGGKETFFRTGRQKGKCVTFWPCLIGRKGKLLRAKESCALQENFLIRTIHTI